MAASGWYVLRTPAGRLSVLWLFAGHPLAIAGPFETFAGAKARMEEEGKSE